MALVPKNLEKSIFDKFSSYQYFTDNYEVYEEFINYFKTTWINKVVKYRHSWKYISIEHNHYLSTKNNGLRTTSSLESWHAKFKSELKTHNPSFSKFFKALQVDLNFHKNKYKELLAFRNEPNKNKKLYITKI